MRVLSILHQKAMASLTMLISWTICKDRNESFFGTNPLQQLFLLSSIKSEARLWASAGAKHLSYVRPGVLYCDPNSSIGALKKGKLRMEQSEAHRRRLKRYGSLSPPIYVPCKPLARVDRIIR
jgi:hypothetical protein